MDCNTSKGSIIKEITKIIFTLLTLMFLRNIFSIKMIAELSYHMHVDFKNISPEINTKCKFYQF